MTLTERLGALLVWLVAIATAVFLLTPLVVTVLVSFGSSAVFTLPPPSWSRRWYQRLMTLRGLAPALLTSVQIAGFATLVSLVLGALSAIALARTRFPGRDGFVAFLTSPLMLPGLVLGIALLHGLRFIGLIDVWTSLLNAHVVITIPYVVRTLYSALGLFDFTLLDAARTLGCSPAEAIVMVLRPNLAPAFITSAIFAFLASMDNCAVSIFFTNAWTKTLPIQMLTYAEEQPDPTIAAMSSLLIALVLVLLIVLEGAIGLRRITEV